MKTLFVRHMTHYERGLMYVRKVQSLMTVTILLELFNMNRKWYLIVMPVFFIFTWMIGFLDKYFKVFDAESKYKNTKNPEIMNINNKINKIYKHYEKN